jgi:hypothetical protein
VNNLNIAEEKLKEAQAKSKWDSLSSKFWKIFLFLDVLLSVAGM